MFAQSAQIFEAMITSSDKQHEELKQLREKQHKESKKDSKWTCNYQTRDTAHLRFYQSKKRNNKQVSSKIIEHDKNSSTITKSFE